MAGFIQKKRSFTQHHGNAIRKLKNRLVIPKNGAGFTLIELLVSVAIFSGIVVLTLGAFARSADSSFRSTAVRERTEAARTIIDRISNDLHYVYLDKPFISTTNDCSNGATSLGINFAPSCVTLLLKYPEASNSELVLRKYILATVDGRTALKLEEAKDCSIGAQPQLLITCNPNRTGILSDIISDKFSVDDAPIFGGVDPYTASQTNVAPLLSIDLTIKPTQFSGPCSTDPASCYSINSSFVPGG